ncbi:MAG: hypothetical protein GTO18_22155 [Anaerolineales bacterium]|nr:hypothetical protein [Anaerolineales bacterium]
MRRFTKTYVGISFLILLGMACGLFSSPTSPPDTIEPAGSEEAAPTPAPTKVPPTEAVQEPTPSPIPDVTEAPLGDPIPHFTSGQPVIITEIHMIDTAIGWGIGVVVESDDHILRTEDGGETWMDVTPPEPKPPIGESPKRASVFFLDGENAWVTYKGETIVWYSSDAGASWRSSDTSHPSNFESTLWFSDSAHGWLLRTLDVGTGNASVTLFRTVDDGSSWDVVVDPYSSTDLQSCYKSGIVFSGDQDGWVTYACMGLYSIPFLDWTTDGGSNWRTEDLPPPPEDSDLFDGFPNCNLHWPTMFSPISGALVLDCTYFEDETKFHETYLYTTSDQGMNWRVDDYPGGELLFVDVNNGFALGQDFYKTTDGGRSWTKVRTVNWDGQFSFVDEDNGWAAARADDEIALVKITEGGTALEMLEPAIAYPEGVVPGATPMGGGSGQIAFISYRANQDDFTTNDIYLMNADGSGITRLTDGAGAIYYFSWSPDGERIVFSSLRDREEELYVINADGSGLIQLTDNILSEFAPAWSPTGDQIAFVQGDGVYVMNPDGSQVKRLSDKAGQTPTWSPDGSQIAFGVWEEGIYIMNADGSGLTQLTDSSEHGYDWYPAWSPDGTLILFASNRHSPGNALTEMVYIMNADGTGIEQLGEPYWGQPPYAWSPDGTLIAYTHDFLSGATLYVMNADGTDPRPLMEDNEGFHPAWRP